MKKQCEIVQDLLPLYVDRACSPSSTELIQEHLRSCPACRDLYNKMSSHTSEELLQQEKESVLTRHERRENQKIIRYIFLALAVLYIPVLLLLPLLTDNQSSFIDIPYLFMLGVFFLGSAPCYLACIELGCMVCRMLDQKEETRGEKAFHLVALALSIGILLTLFDLEKFLYPSLLLAVALVMNWVISAIVYHKKPHLRSIFGKKIFWICLLCFTVLLLVAITLSAFFLTSRNVKEETLEFGYSAGVRETGSEYEGLYFEIGINEQHMWNIFGRNPSLMVKWVNDTDHTIQYDTSCYIYRQTIDGWELCSTDTIEFPPDLFTIPAGGRVSQLYSIAGYDIRESGRYKFVTFIDGKAVWFEFEVTIGATGVALPAD